MNNSQINPSLPVATFIRFSESGKRAFCTVRANAFETTSFTNAYLSAIPFQGMKKGDSLNIPEGYTFQEREDENGETLRYKDGNALQFVSWE